MSMFKSKLSTCHLTYIQKITLTQCSKRCYTVKYPPPPSYYDTKKPRSFKFGILFFILGATISYNYPLYNLGEKLITLPDENNEKACNQYTADLENQLQKLSIVKKYRNDPNYVEYRGWNHLDTTPSGLSSFHGTLLTPGGIAVPPISFHCQETGDDVVIVHVGRRLSGYPFIVHGGVLGTIIDEVFKTNLIKEFPNLSFDTVHTKSLELNYSFPTFVNQFIVINSSLMKTGNNDNTAYSVQSDVSTLDGSLLIKANAILSSDISPSSKSASTPTILQQGPVTCKTGWFW